MQFHEKNLLVFGITNLIELTSAPDPLPTAASADFLDPDSDPDSADSETDVDVTPLSLLEVTIKPDFFIMSNLKVGY